MLSDSYFDQNKLFVDISNQLAQYPKEHWDFMVGRAVSVDFSARSTVIRTSGKDGQTHTTLIPFHALVLATGASTPSPLLTHAPDLRDAWLSLRGELAGAKSVVIAGGGPAGVECAGEVGEYLLGRGEGKAEVTLVVSGSCILPALRPALAEKAEGMLADLGVKILKNTRVERFENGVVVLNNDTEIAADVYIPATGMAPNTQFLAAEYLAEDGRVKTNPCTLRVDAAGPRVYALGDCSAAFRPAIHSIMAAVPVLCANTTWDLSGEAGGEDKVFEEDTRETQLVPIGRSKGVGAAMGWRLPSWVVWLVKGRDYWLWTTGRLWSGKQW
jgi:NADH dehydrogenase FAD-containing subunit